MKFDVRQLGKSILGLRWTLVVVAGLILAAATKSLSTVILLVGVIVMVMVHEFGHFITAKKSGMKVTEYFLGFGPRLWSVQKGETEYGVKGIPAGGYVRIIGMNNLEEVPPEDEARSYRQQPFWQRIIVTSAGSFMHFVMAGVILWSVLVFVGTPGASTTIRSLSALQGSNPAQAAGAQPGDKILSINGHAVSTWDQTAKALGDSQIGQPLPVTVQRGKQQVQINIIPIDRSQVVLTDGTKLASADASKPSGFVGISPASTYVTMGPIKAIPETIKTVKKNSIQVVQSIGHVFSPSGVKSYYQNVTGTVPPSEADNVNQTRMLSPVGLVSYANDAAHSGWFSSLMLLYAINLFVGIFNMVPLLPFDGGHVAVAMYEGIRSIGRKRYYAADFAKLLPVSYAVLLVLLVLSVSSIWLDIVNPAPNPFQ